MIKKVCVCECIVMNEWMDESFDNSFTDCKRPKTKQNLKISIFHSLLWCRWHSDIISIVVIFFQIFFNLFSVWNFFPSMCQWMIVVPASIENELCARKIGIKLLSMFRAKKRQRRQCSKQASKSKKSVWCAAPTQCGAWNFIDFFRRWCWMSLYERGGLFFFRVWTCALANPQTLYYCYYSVIFALHFEWKMCVWRSGRMWTSKTVSMFAWVCVTSHSKSFVYYYSHSQFPRFPLSCITFFERSLSRSLVHLMLDSLFSIHHPQFTASHTHACAKRVTHLLRR